MLKVRVIKKYHDNKGILIGYTIQDETNPADKRNIHKDILKNAVISGQCEVVNMTLTSDGRLIGKAAPKSTPRTNLRMNGVKLLEVYTNGRSIVAALVEEDITRPEYSTNRILHKTIPDTLNFNASFEAMDKIKSGWYDNIKVVNGKPNLDSVKRKSFKNVRNKFIKLIQESELLANKMVVTKGDKKYEYIINLDELHPCFGATAVGDRIVQAIYCLIADAMTTAKIKVTCAKGADVYVECMTGINDVRKALKEVKW